MDFTIVQQGYHTSSQSILLLLSFQFAIIPSSKNNLQYEYYLSNIIAEWYLEQYQNHAIVFPRLAFENQANSLSSPTS